MGMKLSRVKIKFIRLNFYFHPSAEKAGGGCFSTVVD